MMELICQAIKKRLLKQLNWKSLFGEGMYNIIFPRRVRVQSFWERFLSGIKWCHRGVSINRYFSLNTQLFTTTASEWDPFVLLLSSSCLSATACGSSWLVNFGYRYRYPWSWMNDSGVSFRVPLHCLAIRQSIYQFVAILVHPHHQYTWGKDAKEEDD